MTTTSEKKTTELQCLKAMVFQTVKKMGSLNLAAAQSRSNGRGNCPHSPSEIGVIQGLEVLRFIPRLYLSGTGIFTYTGVVDLGSMYHTIQSHGVLGIASKAAMWG